MTADSDSEEVHGISNSLEIRWVSWQAAFPRTEPWTDEMAELVSMCMRALDLGLGEESVHASGKQGRRAGEGRRSR